MKNIHKTLLSTKNKIKITYSSISPRTFLLLPHPPTPGWLLLSCQVT